jgi:hypothetical protein
MSIVHTLPINIHQGETWSRTIVVKDDNDAAKILTGYTGKMQIRNNPGGTLYKELSIGSGMTITGASGEVKYDLTAAETAALNFRTAVYDTYITPDAGVNKTYLLKGDVIVEARVTQ